MANSREPVFNVPSTILALLAVFIAVHGGRQFLTEESDAWFVLAMAFIPARYSGLAGELPGGDVATVTSFVTHMFVHGDIVHLAINSAWMLAFGTVICRRIGGLKFLLFSTLGGIAGALTFLIFHPGLMSPVVGASGAIAAMMGGVIRFLFPALDRHRGWLMRENPAAIPLMDLRTALSDRRVLLTTLVFVAINLLAIVGLGGLGITTGAIAWEAHLGGYLFGLFCFSAFDIAAQNHALNPPDAQ